VFASAQMQTLILLRDSYSRLLTAYDSVREEAVGLRTQLVRASAEHAEETQSLRREIATAQAELSSRLTRIEQLESELAAALHQTAVVDDERAEAVTAREAAAAALAEMRANHLEQLMRWRALFLQLRDQFAELTQPPLSPGSPRSSAASSASPATLAVTPC
jgi:cobalamin-dependent methionine synthase I